jgi:hypothetical protein
MIEIAVFFVTLFGIWTVGCFTLKALFAIADAIF